MNPKIIREKIGKEELIRAAKDTFDTMVKVDVDIARAILTIGGQWHSEGDAILVADGSNHEEVWGVNYYPWRPSDRRIEYVSLINIKPSLQHPQMELKDPEIKEKIKNIVEQFLLRADETLS